MKESHLSIGSTESGRRPLESKAPLLRWSDWLWALLYPVYQTIGTLRHEGSHALAAMAEGARITEFVFWPTEGYWGYVRWEGDTSWFAIAAPYFCDYATFLLAFTICIKVRIRSRWIWINVLILGVLSPLINSAINYRGGILRGQNDIGWLIFEIGASPVHVYFVITLAVYVAGLGYCLWRRRRFERDSGQEGCDAVTETVAIHRVPLEADPRRKQ